MPRRKTLPPDAEISAPPPTDPGSNCGEAKGCGLELAYWFRQMSGKQPTAAALHEYLAVFHGKEIGKVTPEEVIRIVKADYARIHVPGSNGEGIPHPRGPEGTPTDRHVTLDETFVLSLPGKVQRMILQTLNGKGSVPIKSVLLAVYGSKDDRNLEALLLGQKRLNQLLAKKEKKCEVKKEGKTLILSRI